MMSFDDFLQLDDFCVAELMKEHKSKVCAFPINGTRRWFKLEYPEQFAGQSVEDFLRILWREHLRVYSLLFEHGVGTLLAPITGPDILARDASYQRLIEPGLLWLCESEDALAFYEANEVRVRFYGDIEGYFGNTDYAHLIGHFEELMEKTAVNQGPLLLFGICAHDATESVAKIGHTFYQTHQRLPNKQEIVEAYFGTFVDSVDFFIGFDRLAVFDMPLVSTGQEDLYFTVAPSLYMDKVTLRTILYDHLYGRNVSESYQSKEQNSNFMQNFYKLNRHHVIGIGQRSADGSFWYPLPQVQLPHS